MASSFLILSNIKNILASMNQDQKDCLILVGSLANDFPLNLRNHHFGNFHGNLGQYQACYWRFLLSNPYFPFLPDSSQFHAIFHHALCLPFFAGSVAFLNCKIHCIGHLGLRLHAAGFLHIRKCAQSAVNFSVPSLQRTSTADCTNMCSVMKIVPHFYRVTS